MTLTLDDDRLDETFAALANTTRRSILARLAEGAATVNELAEPFELTLPAISKHIKVLERAGLVSAGTTRPVPTVRARPGTARSGLHLGRAVPADLGGPAQPHGRLPPGTRAARKAGSPMTDDGSIPQTQW